MKVILEKSEGLSRYFKAEIPGEMIQQSFNQVYRNIQKSIVMKGFRKGHVPLTTISHKYTQEATDQVKKNLIRKVYDIIKDQHQFDIASTPEINHDTLNPLFPKDQLFYLSIKLEIFPQATNLSYENICLKKNLIKIETKQILEITKLIGNKYFFDCFKDNPQHSAQMGDTIILDLSYKVEETPKAKLKKQTIPIFLHKDSFWPGFVEKIIGLKIKQEHTFSLKIDNTYHDKKMAGKTVSCTVVIKNIGKTGLDFMTDEEIENSKDEKINLLKKSAMEIIKTNNEKIENGTLKLSILIKIIKDNQLEVPPHFFKFYKESIKNTMESQNISPNKKSLLNYYLQTTDLQKKNNMLEKITLFVTRTLILNHLLSKKFNISIPSEQIESYKKNPQSLYELFLVHFTLNHTGIVLFHIEDFLKINMILEKILKKVKIEEVKKPYSIEKDFLNLLGLDSDSNS